MALREESGVPIFRLSKEEVIPRHQKSVAQSVEYLEQLYQQAVHDTEKLLKAMQLRPNEYGMEISLTKRDLK